MTYTQEIDDFINSYKSQNARFTITKSTDSAYLILEADTALQIANSESSSKTLQKIFSEIKQYKYRVRATSDFSELRYPVTTIKEDLYRKFILIILDYYKQAHPKKNPVVTKSFKSFERFLYYVISSPTKNNFIEACIPILDWLMAAKDFAAIKSTVFHLFNLMEEKYGEKTSNQRDGAAVCTDGGGIPF